FDVSLWPECIAQFVGGGTAGCALGEEYDDFGEESLAFGGFFAGCRDDDGAEYTDANKARILLVPGFQVPVQVGVGLAAPLANCSGYLSSASGECERWDGDGAGSVGGYFA